MPPYRTSLQLNMSSDLYDMYRELFKPLGFDISQDVNSKRVEYRALLMASSTAQDGQIPDLMLLLDSNAGTCDPDGWVDTDFCLRTTIFTTQPIFNLFDTLRSTPFFFNDLARQRQFSPVPQNDPSEPLTPPLNEPLPDRNGVYRYSVAVPSSPRHIRMEYNGTATTSLIDIYLNPFIRLRIYNPSDIDP